MPHSEKSISDILKPMRIVTLCLYLNVLLLIFNPLAKAEVYDLYRGARGNGMGGADTAVVNDETSLLINPAGLGKLRNTIGTLIDPEVDIGINAYSMYVKKSFSSFTDLAKIQPSLDLTRETHFHFKDQIFPSFVLKNFGMGVLIKESLDAIMNADGTTITANYFNDWVFVTGFNFRFWDGRIKLGVNAKAINRVQASGDFPVAQSLAIKDIAKEGYGLGSDAGLILSAPWDLLPTLSVVVRDIGTTRFTNTGLKYKLLTKPDSMPQDADVAIAFFPIHSSYVRSSFTFEYKHVLTASQYDNKTQLYHFGWETNINDLTYLRFGMNGSYYSAGIELASERTQFQFAYYGEEVGINGEKKQDLRYTFKAALRF